ncbi:N-formylglutamate amidohydrolase [Formosa sp. PL04]|uniref:N-formylglutamate amidohydrolase n=1 Tax=Formosa sp. PL04 TaxID=3081755 RepID=UPI0029811875|nr:N-formylglutamate amidohydrolase [Formosa sp. PL04]MDW5288653.1 N-formylglutamate amidohydrolase [Formosa sp. PL04]
MEKLSLKNIVKKIEAKERFHAVASDYSFTLKIDKYVPFICGAVHDGHHFKRDLWDFCTHSEYERWYEEDPETKTMVSECPIVISGLDSRFEYDLNRAPEDAIYKDAWGKPLWKKPLLTSLKDRALNKHHEFYNVLHKLVSTVEDIYGHAVVYDMHSFNVKRWDREVPTWNLGTKNVDESRFKTEIENWRQLLSEITLSKKIPSTAHINDTFQGNGYFLKYITSNFTNTLVLATEIAKVYCNEKKALIYPEIVSNVRDQLGAKIKSHAAQFYNTYSK